MSSLSVFIPLLSSGLIVDEPLDLNTSADWVGQTAVEFVNGSIRIEVSIAAPCESCDTEWRLGFRAMDSESTVPELLLSHTQTDVWWDENMNWQYPSHLGTPIPFTEQDWIIHTDTNIVYTISMSDLPSHLWFGMDIGLYSISSEETDWFGEGWSDDINIDDDGDALNSLEEHSYGTVSDDGDCDDDGILDGIEVLQGTNPLECDTDADGLTDGLEQGITSPSVYTEEGCFVGDRQPSTTTDPLLSDSDGGGLSDGEEDRDQDGLIDQWETDPMDPSDDLDDDEDGILDAVEDRCAAGFSDDADGDGLIDIVEGWLDTDEDGTPNFCDEDDDNDGIPSSVEGSTDWDGDGIINAYDTDSDDDGILDSDESIHDTDCDDNPSWLDDNPDDGPCSDSDLDGLLNSEEEACGTDPFNPDTDGDGILDVYDCTNESDTPWNAPENLKEGPNWDSGCAVSSTAWLLLLTFRRTRKHHR